MRCIFRALYGVCIERHMWGDQRSTRRTIRPYDLRNAFRLIYIYNGANAFAQEKTLDHGDIEGTRRYFAPANEDWKVEHGKSSQLKKLTARTIRSMKRQSHGLVSVGVGVYLFSANGSLTLMLPFGSINRKVITCYSSRGHWLDYVVRYLLGKGVHYQICNFMLGAN